MPEGSTATRVTFTFASGGSGGYKYSYDFGDTGTFEITRSGPTATIPESYLDDGPATLTVRGRITDSKGNYTDYTRTINIFDVAPKPAITVPKATDVGLTNTFQASATSPSSADMKAGFTFTWNFGDNTPNVKGASPTHKYAAAGTYIVTVTAVDADGGTAVGSTRATITVRPLPTANFTDPPIYEGSTNATVEFLNVVGGNPAYTYSYDFGNTGTFEITGSSSSTATIPESYLDTAGTLVVHGRVTDSVGGYTDYTTTVVIADAPPTPTITLPPAIDLGVPATFQGSATSPSNADMQAGFDYTWNFGDGSPTVTGAAPTHTYTQAGTYMVTLTAVDADGGTVAGTTSATVTIIGNSPTTTFTGPTSVSEGTTTAQVAFTNPTGGSGSYTYSYDFGNTGTFEITGSTSPTATIPESYVDDAGTVVVRGRITDSAGAYTDYTTTIAINDVAPTPSITVPSGAEAGVAGTFQASATSPSNADMQAGFSYTWSFGDGTPLVNGAAPTHSYAKAGSYTVTLSAVDQGGGLTGSTKATVTVIAPPTATFSGPSAVSAGATNAQVSFANPAGGSGSGYTYSYDFGNTGTFEITGSGPTATIPESYVDSGPSTLVVRGRITDSAGGYTDYTTSITVNDTAPTPKISGPSSAEAGTSIAFTGSATDPSSADTKSGFTYSWIFGDGTSPVSGADPSHTFTKDGTYTVTLKATDVHAQSGTTTASITIGSGPTATFSGPSSVSSGTNNAQVKFTNPTGGSGGYTYSYDWGDTGTFEISGSASATATIPESYVDNGPATLVVRGRITDSAGAYTDYTTSITINDTAPTPSISGPTSSDVGLANSFAASATDPSSSDTKAGFTYKWNFGDGSSTVTGATPTHTFTKAGTYTITLTATDQHGTVGTTTESFTVAVLPTATFSGPSSVNAGATNATVTFANPTGGSGGYTYSYDWANTGTFQITGSSSATGTIPESYVDAPGTLVVHGRITDSAGGYTDYTTSITINDTAPTPSISGPTSGEATVAESFTASATDPSSSDTNAGFTYKWNFGDGTSAVTGATPTHTFTKAGTYTITLTATDQHGTAGTTTESFTVIAAPTATFSGPSSVNAGATNAQVTFAGATGGSGGYTYSYDWADTGTFELTGTSATAIIPEAYVDNGGSLTVRGRISDSNGGYTDYTTKITINNVAPTASISPPGALTVGTAATFTGSATDPSTADTNGGFTYAWTFGDGGTATGATPSHTYSAAGSYTVALTVTDMHGLTGNASTTVTVSSQSGLNEPLLNSSDLQLLGAFRVPNYSTSVDNLSYGGTALAYDASRNGLFIVGQHQAITEISIPSSIVNSSNLANLATSTILQPFTDVVDQLPGPLSGTTDGAPIGGLLAYNGDLIGTQYAYYSGANAQTTSHFVLNSLNLSTAQVQGLYGVNGDARLAAGYMTTIPSEWQSVLGYPVLTGLSDVPIISTVSSGPAAIGFNPSNLSSSSQAPGTNFLYYPASNPLGPFSSAVDPLQSGTSQIGGMVFVPGTNSILFIGATGTNYDGYGPPGQEGPWSLNGQYTQQIWAYNANDLLAVKQGTLQPWQVQPYDVWNFQFPIASNWVGSGIHENYVGGVAFDPSTDRLYVSLLYADMQGGPALPVIYVFQVNVPSGSPGSVAPQVGTLAATPTNISTWPLQADAGDAATGPIPAGTSMMLTAGNAYALTAGSSITQVAFYVDSNGDGRLDAGDQLLGYGTPSTIANAGHNSTLTISTTGWKSGTYTLFAQVEDSAGLFSNVVSTTITIA